MGPVDATIILPPPVHCGAAAAGEAILAIVRRGEVR
jgi:hypothetical protein